MLSYKHVLKNRKYEADMKRTSYCESKGRSKRARFLSGKRRVTGIVLATILGYITPFCSCSTVPVAAGMLGATIPLGVVVAFVFASPYPIEIGAIVLGPVFGWHLAIIFSVVGLVIALLMGLIVNKLDWRDQISSGFNQLVYPRTRNPKNEVENVVQNSSSGYNSLESDPNQCDCLPRASIQECECENSTNARARAKECHDVFSWISEDIVSICTRGKLGWSLDLWLYA